MGTRSEKEMTMRLKTVRLIVMLALGLLSAPLAPDAQTPPKIPRLGIIEDSPDWGVFRQGLRELGYVEGQNIALVFPSGEVRPERLPHLAAELVSLKVDIIVAAGGPGVRAAQQATKTIPIVMPVINDPVAAGFVASLARPGGNITGLTLISSDLIGKRLELLKASVPRVSRIAVLFHPAIALVPPLMREMNVAARALGVQLQLLEVRAPEDFEMAFQAARRGGAGVLITLDDTFVFTHHARIVKLAAKNRLPAIYGFREFVDAGGLMSYAANLTGMYRRAATYVDKILKGAKPADLPVEQPTKFEFVLNLKTAKALGLTIPQSVLIRADQVIQ